MYVPLVVVILFYESHVLTRLTIQLSNKLWEKQPPKAKPVAEVSSPPKGIFNRLSFAFVS